MWIDAWGDLLSGFESRGLKDRPGCRTRSLCAGDFSVSSGNSSSRDLLAFAPVRPDAGGQS